jgi:EAL domain-containing protein (putative c-di-GMP-specific phosphodiesterase class I)
VESEEQFEYLAANGCTLIQGYHTGRPLLPEDVTDLLKSQVIAPSELQPAQ